MDLFESVRIQELEQLIKKYQDSYYNGEAEISDAEFDSLWDELKQLDPNNPILHKIGSDSGLFAKVQHRIPMGSQEKAANPEEFLEWAKKHPYKEYLVEYKLDGASMELQYDNGVFVRAVTRGNGIIGDDVTANVLKMSGVKTKLEHNGILQNFTGGIRGEVIMTRKVHRAFFPDKANCRNAANGIMKRKDGQGSEHLNIICYDAYFENHTFTDEEEKILWLKKCGFETVDIVICKNPTEVISYRAEVMEKRAAMDFDIDGLVIKERNIDLDDAAKNRPDKQIAFKFSLEEAVTVLRQVQWSESGATYTPVAIFDPVELAGTTVKRASLANPNIIRSLDIRIGSHVVVTKRGEIIPKIESVVPGTSENMPKIPFPEKCSVCSATLVDEGTRLYCPNRQCAKLILHRLKKWVDVLDIRDLGESLINSLFESGKVRSVADLYSLTEEDLSPYFLNEESLSKNKKSLGAEKVLKSLTVRNSVSLEAFVAGFDIEGIGETLMEKICDAGFNSIEKLFNATEEEIATINGFGEITAKTFVRGLRENKQEMQELISKGYISIKETARNGTLAGRSFCFTGELSIKRNQAEKMVKSAGGTVKSSVVKGLSYLVTNDTKSGSAKNKKAAELGIPVIDEATFLNLFT
ncbi:MAG: NAD-dependent DNA ligase LigA [Spirochaetaceae bacterium]|nr:NAD-dependent DNA ligase LigA [Spirochaetaceae bacterium]